MAPKSSMVRPAMRNFMRVARRRDPPQSGQTCSTITYPNVDLPHRLATTVAPQRRRTVGVALDGAYGLEPRAIDAQVHPSGAGK